MKFYDNQLSDSLVKDVAAFMKESKKPSIKYDDEGAHVLDASGKVARTFKQRDNGDDFKKKAQNYLTQKMRELNASFEPKEPLIAEKSLDPVDKKELKGKHKDRADKDIDNDGDVDSSDKYLHKKRKAISKAMKEDAEVEETNVEHSDPVNAGEAFQIESDAPKVKEETEIEETTMMSGDKKKKSMPEIKKDMEKAVDKANDKLKEEAATMVDRVVAEISDQMKKRYISKAQKEITSKEKEKDMVRKNMDKNPDNFSDANKKSSDAKYDAETNKRRKGIRQAASKLGGQTAKQSGTKLGLSQGMKPSSKKLGEAEDLNKDNAEKAMKHDCAKHVAHESYGEGTCVPGMHTIVEDENGEYFVSHYDVMFESEDGYNIVEDIPVEELKIYTEAPHSHGNKKKKGY